MLKKICDRLAEFVANEWEDSVRAKIIANVLATRALLVVNADLSSSGIPCPTLERWIRCR